MKKVISLFVITALVLPLLCMPISATEVNAVEYIVNNVDALADVYAQLHPDSDEVFEGQSVELLLPVTIISTNSTGTYIDFDGDNGYMVVQGNNEVIAWEVSGDLTYLKDLESTYFSIVDGFGYLNGGSFVLYETNAVDQESVVAGSAYNGQDGDVAGDGIIWNYISYMSDRYDGYSFVGYDVLDSTFEYVNQDSFSFYHTITANGALASEGNCGLSAVYALLNYLGSSGKCNFPNSSDMGTYYPANDYFYEIYAEDPEYAIPNSVSVPRLYYAVRQCAVENFIYQTGGFETSYTDDVIEMVAEQYSNNVDATIHSLGSFDSHVVPEIAEDDPVYVCVSNSSTYGTHAMVVTGYRIYKKTTTILGINYTNYVYLLRVNDNWQSDARAAALGRPTAARYLDLTAYGRNCIYITVEVNES